MLLWLLNIFSLLLSLGPPQICKGQPPTPYGSIISVIEHIWQTQCTSMCYTIDALEPRYRWFYFQRSSHRQSTGLEFCMCKCWPGSIPGRCRLIYGEALSLCKRFSAGILSCMKRVWNNLLCYSSFIFRLWRQSPSLPSRVAHRVV